MGIVSGRLTRLMAEIDSEAVFGISAIYVPILLPCLSTSSDSGPCIAPGFRIHGSLVLLHKQIQRT